MQNILIFFITTILVSTLPVSVCAMQTSGSVMQGGQMEEQGVQERDMSRSQIHVETATVSVPEGSALENQSKTRMQNQGEDMMIRQETEMQEQFLGGSDGMMKNLDAVLMMNMVQGGPGEKVQNIVREQAEVQNRIRLADDAMDSRQGFMKFLIGPDYSSLQEIKDYIAENQVRIAELEELKSQMADEGDMAMVESVIQALTDQNISLTEKVTAQEQTRSMFGWLMRLFVQK